MGLSGVAGLSVADKNRLADVCWHYLYETRWAGELGDPVPRSHTASVDRRNVTEIRHSRDLCRRLGGETS